MSADAFGVIGAGAFELTAREGTVLINCTAIVGAEELALSIHIGQYTFDDDAVA